MKLYIYALLGFLLLTCSFRENRREDNTLPNTIPSIRTTQTNESCVLKNEFRSYLHPHGNSTFSWTDWETSLDRSVKIKLIQRIRRHTYMDLFIPTENPGHRFNSFHVLDINADGFLDIIYQDSIPEGIESIRTALYLNLADTALHLMIKDLGRVTGIHRIHEDSAIDLQIESYPCCMNSIYTMKNYSFRKSFPDNKPQTLAYRSGYSRYFDSTTHVSMIETLRYWQGTTIPSTFCPIWTDTIQYNTDIFQEPHSGDRLSNPDIIYGFTSNQYKEALKAGTVVTILADSVVNTETFECFRIEDLTGASSVDSDFVCIGLIGWRRKSLK